MNVGLIDVDGHNWPNLCLMKLSAYHKAKGDNVEWWRPEGRYDLVYKSRVFTNLYSKDAITVTNAERVICGGTGYGKPDKLPDEVEHGRAVLCWRGNERQRQDVSQELHRRVHGGRGHCCRVFDLLGFPVQQRARRGRHPARRHDGVGVHRTAHFQYADPHRPCPGSEPHCKGDVRPIRKYSVIALFPRIVLQASLKKA